MCLVVIDTFFVLLLDIKGKRIWTWAYILAIIQSHVTSYNVKLLLDLNHSGVSLQNVYNLGHKKVQKSMM